MSTRQLCPYCQYANELGNQYCGQCGQSLTNYIPAGNRRSFMTVGNGNMLPTPSIKQLGQAVAVSMIALVAEAGLILIRRRLNSIKNATPKNDQVALVPEKQKQPRTITSQRIVQIWRNGKETGRFTEQSIWQDME